jgi:hypothetical protein
MDTWKRRMKDMTRIKYDLIMQSEDKKDLQRRSYGKEITG